MAMVKKGFGSTAFDIGNTIFMIALIITMAYPLINVVAVSLSHRDVIDMGWVKWLPKRVTLAGYDYILGQKQLLITYKNTILYAGGGTIITLLLTSLMAYPLAVKGFILSRFISIFLAITLFFSGGLIPTYLLIRNLGMIDTYFVMVIPGAISAFSVFIYRTFFRSLPDALRESAFMDGANDIRVLFTIILPLSKALLATFALFSIVSHWNSYFQALIYLNDRNKYPLQMFLREIIIVASSGTDNREIFAALQIRPELHHKNLQMAAIVVTMVPILMIYPFIQKYFTKGIMIGAIKG
jgi:putative aldouronate transport system permease protein